jgi:hypothetical protein
MRSGPSRQDLSWQFGVTRSPLIEDPFISLHSRDVSGKIDNSRPEGLLRSGQLIQAVASLDKRSIGTVVVIGGGGSRALSRLSSEKGVQGIGIPSTLQDDICGIETHVGVDSALNNITITVEHMPSCYSSRNHTFWFRSKSGHTDRWRVKLRL